MEFENDYIMRLIKQTIRAIVSIMMGKEFSLYDYVQDELHTESDGLYDRMIALVNNGKINEAENLMYEELDFSDKKELLLAMSFYEYLNDLDDEYLTTHNFSRKEIQSGLEDAGRMAGIGNLLDTLKEDE